MTGQSTLKQSPNFNGTIAHKSSLKELAATLQSPPLDSRWAQKARTFPHFSVIVHYATGYQAILTRTEMIGSMTREYGVLPVREQKTL